MQHSKRLGRLVSFSSKPVLVFASPCYAPQDGKNVNVQIMRSSPKLLVAWHCPHNPVPPDSECPFIPDTQVKMYMPSWPSACRNGLRSIPPLPLADPC